MKTRRFGKFTVIGFAILLMLVVAILLSNSLRRSSRIILPDMTKMNEIVPGTTSQDNAAITPITVTPETVQAAIESLRRPGSYRRTITVERLWSGGSGISEVIASVYGDWTRTEVTPADGQTRHTLTDGTDTYIWYGNQRDYYHAAAGGITADQEQSIPTYEDVLELPPTQIEKADYRTVSGVNCIYVETGEDENGHVLRYWVSVDTGLLAKAEWQEAGETIYRMDALTLDAVGPTSADFTLPDGVIPME